MKQKCKDCAKCVDYTVILSPVMYIPTGSKVCLESKTFIAKKRIYMFNNCKWFQVKEEEK